MWQPDSPWYPRQTRDLIPVLRTTTPIDSDAHIDDLFFTSRNEVMVCATVGLSTTFKPFTEFTYYKQNRTIAITREELGTRAGGGNSKIAASDQDKTIYTHDTNTGNNRAIPLSGAVKVSAGSKYIKMEGPGHIHLDPDYEPPSESGSEGGSNPTIPPRNPGMFDNMSMEDTVFGIFNSSGGQLQRINKNALIAWTANLGGSSQLEVVDLFLRDQVLSIMRSDGEIHFYNQTSGSAVYGATPINNSYGSCIKFALLGMSPCVAFNKLNTSTFNFETTLVAYFAFINPLSGMLSFTSPVVEGPLTHSVRNQHGPRSILDVQADSHGSFYTLTSTSIEKWDIRLNRIWIYSDVSFSSGQPLETYTKFAVSKIGLNIALVDSNNNLKFIEQV